MRRVVLDTNVIVSGLAFAGSNQDVILQALARKQFERVSSEFLRAELERTLQKPVFAQRLALDPRNDMIDLLSRSREVGISRPVVGIASHSEDDFVLATALSAGADFVVTGDKQLLKIGAHQGIRIVDSRRFLEILDEESGA